MLIERFDIEGLLLIKPRVFEDNRGYFFESFNKQEFSRLTALDLDFVQDNESMSDAGVLRGLHSQAPPHQQGKLVRVVQGKVLDVAVDIRKNSPTYGQYQSVILSGENKNQFYIPPGFAHGFVVLENKTLFCYKCTGYYNKESEMSIRWNDEDINIDWGIKNPILSEKDEKNSVSLISFNSPF